MQLEDTVMRDAYGRHVSIWQTKQFISTNSVWGVHHDHVKTVKCPIELFIVILLCRFFGFNWYRLSIGIHYDLGCTPDIDKSQTLELSNQDINETTRNEYYVSSESFNHTVFLVAYPCEWGFDYLTCGAAVWLVFLPFYITQLLGNCWRQCCCCLCDPLV